MKTTWISAFLLLLCVTAYTRAVPAKKSSSNNNNKLLLILFDGFRWDYFGNFSGLPNFDRFRSEGVHAEYMTPNFPSLSYPGYYSVLTGRYVESHGFIENTMYDKYQDMYFYTDTDVNGSQPFWWNYTEPFWTTSVKNNLKTSVYRWPGCHVEIDNTLPTYYEKYEYFNDTEELQRNLEDIVLKFSMDEADVGIVYTEYTDIVGHHYGPESDEIRQAVEQVDKVIGQLLRQLKMKNLENKVNIILVSDHGMTDTQTATKLHLDNVLNVNDVEHFLGYGAITGIKPVQGRLEKVYKDLKKVSDVYVWKDFEIPEELHFKNHYRVPPLVLVAKPNVFIEPLVNNSKFYPPVQNQKFYAGFHGYLPSDSKDMGAIFLAHGPDFRSNYSAPPIYMVDAYNMLTHLVKIEGHSNNGTWGNMKYMLKSGNDATFGAAPTLCTFLSCRLLFSSALVVFFYFLLHF